MTKNSKLLSSYLKQKQLNAIKELMPQMFDGDLLNLNKLKNYLDSSMYINQGNYGLNWFDKQQAIELAKEECLGKLLLDKEKSRAPESGNLLIEGDNLSVLKLLKKDYEGKIKVVYFDPPYNTGKQFAFNDNFQFTSNQYLEYLNEINPGRVDRFMQHNIESGENHTQWLNMMLPRLILSYDFLSEDGLVYLSIDESEKHNLQIMCNEVFGESNFIGSFIWENRSVANDSQNLFSTIHEYILMYAKNKELVQFKGEEKDLSTYTNPDNDPNGDWTADNPTAASGNDNSRFSIQNPLTGEEYIPPSGRYWAFSKNRVKEWIASGKMVFPKELGKRFLLKKYKSELRTLKKPISSVITDIPTSKGTKELKNLYPEGLPFKHPKPTDLLMRLFEQISDDGDIILDPFAGSASTAHAVFKLNHKENCNRKFICIQNDEALALNAETISLGFTNLSEVAQDRIERAGKLFSSENVGFNYLKLTFEQE